MTNTEQKAPETYSVKDFLNKEPEIFDNEDPFETLIGQINSFHRIANENGIKPDEAKKNFAIYTSHKKENGRIVIETEVVTPIGKECVTINDFTPANARGIKRYPYEENRNQQVLPYKDQSGIKEYFCMMQDIIRQRIEENKYE